MTREREGEKREECRRKRREEIGEREEKIELKRERRELRRERREEEERGRETRKGERKKSEDERESRKIFLSASHLIPVAIGNITHAANCTPAIAMACNTSPLASLFISELPAALG